MGKKHEPESQPQVDLRKPETHTFIQHCLVCGKAKLYLARLRRHGANDLLDSRTVQFPFIPTALTVCRTCLEEALAVLTAVLDE